MGAYDHDEEKEGEYMQTRSMSDIAYCKDGTTVDSKASRDEAIVSQVKNSF